MTDTFKNKSSKAKSRNTKPRSRTTSRLYSQEFISALEQSPLKTLEEHNYIQQKKLEKLILDAKDTYYNNTNIITISDNCFDELIEILEEKYPKSKILDSIGSELGTDSINKVKLPYHLGSMDKVKPGSRKLPLWFEKYSKGPYAVSEKLDGLSGLLVITLNTDINSNTTSSSSVSNQHPLSSRLYTRGNGKVGQDISHLLPFLKFLKGSNDSLTSRYDLIKRYMTKNKLEILAIRGEIICTKERFNKKYKSTFPKARSLVAGIVNSKAESFTKQDMRTRAKDIDFVSYQIVAPELIASTQFKELTTSLHFKTANNKVYTTLNSEICQELLLEYKSESVYEIDGIILTDCSKIHPQPLDGNPKHSVAFKMPLEDTQAKETVVELVEYNISKNGILKPRIKYHPIEVGGDTLIYTTGFNARYIKDNNLGPGSRISIIKSGDVIPYIYKILSPSISGKWQQPSSNIKWHWNDNQVEAVIDDVTDLPMEKVMLQFFNQFEIDGLKEGQISRLIDAGFDNINDILRLKEESLLSIEGFQIKSSRKLVSQIKSKILDQEHDINKLMVASNCFPNFGNKKLKLITDNYKVKDILDRKITQDSLEKIDGLGTITSADFLKYLPTFLEWLKEHTLLKIDTSEKKKTTQKAANIDSYVSGKKIVFTGFRDKELEQYISNNNGILQSGVSGTTNLVVAKDITDSSSKLEKAKSKNIKIISLEEFLGIINYKK